MTKKILIGGIGNVLLGDDAVGPFIIGLLESQYTFGDSVEVADLGTPALDAVILIDCIAPCDHPPGTILLFGKDEMLRIQPAQRFDSHAPALSECLMTAEMLGASPKELLLVGIVGECFEPGNHLSPALEFAVERAIVAILSELQQLGIPYEKRQSSLAPSIWWSNFPQSLPALIKEH